MKPAEFEYVAPRTVEDTLAALAGGDEDAKLIAGGQSLVPAMNFRLARPTLLVDLAHVRDLTSIRLDNDSVRVGAMVTHRCLETTTAIPGPLGQLLRTTARWIGHLPIRTRGTFGGSIAHADPAAEWCLLVRTLDARLVLRSASGTREVPASDFFVSVFTTAIESQEVLTEVSLPLMAPTWRVGFSEFSRRSGDFAVASAMTAVDIRDGVIVGARVGLGAVADRPVRAMVAEHSLIGQPPGRARFREAADLAATSVEPVADIQGSREFRQDLVRAMVERALDQSVSEGSRDA